MLKASIAMCTCNGAPWLAEQLDSFLTQRRQPDELVICDDRSTDDTLTLLHDFAARAPFPVHVHQNPANLGFARNFAKAITLCQHEIIFPADQDDHWLPDKLEQFMRIFHARPDVTLVGGHSLVTDANLKPLGYTLAQSQRYPASHWHAIGGPRTFPLVLRHPILAGHALAFRRDILPALLPIPTHWLHDQWIFCIAAALGEVALIDRPVVLYRQHGSNVSGGNRKSIATIIQENRRLADINRTLIRKPLHTDALKALRLHRRLKHQTPRLRNPAADLTFARRRAQFILHRAHLWRKQKFRRWPIILADLLRGRYHRYARGLKTAARDALG